MLGGDGTGNEGTKGGRRNGTKGEKRETLGGENEEQGRFQVGNNAGIKTLLDLDANRGQQYVVFSS
jgi:hypothetical protein